MKLLSCPMCGEKAEVGEYYGESLVFCTGCGVQTRSTRKRDAIAAWNRRAPIEINDMDSAVAYLAGLKEGKKLGEESNLHTPEPGTGVVRWVRFDGTPETLPWKHMNVIMVREKDTALVHLNAFGNKWFSTSAGVFVDVEIGDVWSYCPEPTFIEEA